MATNGRPTFVSCSVEGTVDEPVAVRLVEHVGASVGTVYVKHGKARLLERLAGYNNAAKFQPWLVLLDLDQDAECAPSMLGQLPAPAEGMCLRIAVRAVEAWLMADAERFAEALAVAPARVPSDPDGALDPKDVVVEMARHSRSSYVRSVVPPQPGSGRKVGPFYSSLLIEFASDVESGWRPDVASLASPSLNDALTCLDRMVVRRR